MVLNTVIAGNSLPTWAVALLIGVASSIGLLLFKRVAVARARSLAARTSTRVDDLIVRVFASTRVFFLVASGVAIGSQWLAITPAWWDRLRAVFVLASFAQAGLWATTAARELLNRYRQEKLETDPGAASMVGALKFAVLLVMWVVVVLLALDNLGVNVTALVAGLGVGGIAVALAVQNILGDLFASLAIILDRPFVVRDFIAVGDAVGTVEKIGLKTTRVRSLSGEQIVFANSDLLGSRVRNFGRMEERRITFTLGVTYQTPHAALERIPDLLRDAIVGDDAARFDRSHLSGYGAYSIDFETVYYVNTADYNAYMDVQQRIYLKIHRAFEEEQIEFAYPTQSVFLERAAS